MAILGWMKQPQMRQLPAAKCSQALQLARRDSCTSLLAVRKPLAANWAMDLAKHAAMAKSHGTPAAGLAGGKGSAGVGAASMGAKSSCQFGSGMVRNIVLMSLMQRGTVSCDFWATLVPSIRR